MPSAEQLEGLKEYRAARAAHAKATTGLLAAMAPITNARATLEDALTRGGGAAADGARQRLQVLEARRDKAAAARDGAAAALAAGRARALGAGSGFDLLSSRHPLLLLPVRLETRFAWRENDQLTFADTANAERVLVVRVYPDDIHDDAHEPELSPNELSLLKELEQRLDAARDFEHLDEVWSDVIRRVGPTRAGWLGELIARGNAPGRRPRSFSRPSVARLLPDRWVATAELDDGTTHTAQSRPVQEPLETGPSPAEVDWMVDLDVALRVGMALVIPNLPAGLQQIRRLVVLGARGTLDPSETAAELEALLDAHHYTRGLSFLAPGTPTNSLPGSRAGFTSRPAVVDVISIERRRFEVGMRPRPLAEQGVDGGGDGLARALGIQVGTFAYVQGADATDQQDEWALRMLLATATRRQLARLLPGILDDSQLNEVLDFGVSSLSATGHFPTLRVGAQPYGVLPVLLRNDNGVPPDPFVARLLPVLDSMRALWAQATSSFRWVGDPGPDPGATLIRILQQDGVAGSIAFRPLLGPQLATEVLAALGGGLPLQDQRDAAAAAINALGAHDALSSPLLEALHLGFAPPLTAPIVEPAGSPPTSPQRVANYLELVASLRPDFLMRHQYPGAERPNALLFSIARLAMLERADAAARAVHVAAGEDPALWDEEDVSASRDALATPLGRMEADYQSVLPIGGFHLAPVGFHLSEAPSAVDPNALSDLRRILRSLKRRPPELLDELLRASLGLFSHRLDAWYTALAVQGLDWLRNDMASMTGLNVGAFGVVENLEQSPRQPAPDNSDGDLFKSPTNGGYVHAPSVNHGAAAAVLRSVHLAHAAAGHGEAFSVDLSSERVRRGLELFEGIRAGQPLAALLGYRIERQLAAERLQTLIAPLRQVAPLVADTLTPSTEPVEANAATNVVDGLTLLADAGYDGERPPTAAALWAKHASLPIADVPAVERVLEAAADTLDAAADLAVAEGVYQAVQGNPTRSGATVDGLSGAPVPPPEIGVVGTPRTGVGVTHRLLVLLGDPVADGWASTPRALAEPRLEAWARATLPAPADIGIRARFIHPRGKEVAALDRLTLASLHEAATPDDKEDPGLRLGALDLVALADPHETPHRSALELRLAALIELVRPATAADATLELVFERRPTWDEKRFGLVETLEIARQLRDVISRARPLAPTDLVPPSAAPTTSVPAAELPKRATQATDALLDSINVLAKLRKSSQNTAKIREALFSADSFGVAGAAPATVRDTLGESAEAETERARELAELGGQVDATLAELRRREDAARTLPSADGEARLKAIFGERFTVLSALDPGVGVKELFAAAATPDGADEPAARAWLSRAARVRESTGALDGVLAYADAVAATKGNRALATLHVGQVGGVDGERWVALPRPAGDTMPGGRVSLVAVTPGRDLPAGPVTGLLVDEWVEVVPSAEETTSVAFHYDAPTATAPQVCLLGVPPLGHEMWTVADARAVVDEALALARIRLVGMDDVPDVGQLLPAFVTAENPAGGALGLDVETLTEVS